MCLPKCTALMHITNSYIKDLYRSTHVAAADWFLHSAFWSAPPAWLLFSKHSGEYGRN